MDRGIARNLKAVILDMDGLMVDSEPLSHQAWTEVLSVYGAKLGDEIYFQLIGWRLDQTARFLHKSYKLPVQPGELARIKEQRLAEIRREKGVQTMPGLMGLLDEVEKRKLPWAVATSSKRSTAEEILAGLGLSDRCRGITGGDEVERGKPSPEIYLLAAKRLDIAPGCCLALEDSLPGLKSAQAAGMVTVAVPGRHARYSGFEHADYLFPTLNEVLDKLDKLVSFHD